MTEIYLRIILTDYQPNTASRPAADGILQLKSIGFELPVAALYAGADSAK